MPKIKTAILVGSSRKASINVRLAKAFVKLAPDTLEFIWVRMDDMPFYNPDLEPARTPEIIRFTDALKSCDAVLAVTPEYNRSIPAVLKNAIDWGSKPMPDNVWRNKVIAIAGTSPGQIGTAVGQQHLRQIFGILGAIVMGGECYVKFPGDDVLADDGILNDADTAAFLRTYITQFADLASRLSR